MANMSALEMLAPELQLQTLFNAATPDDLHALIQASPRIYQVFLLNKDTLLSAVARRQFHPAVIPDALFVVAISKFKRPLPRDTVIDLCKIYPGEQDDGSTFPMTTSVALCKLASNLKFFIEDYARNTLPIMEGLGRSLKIDVLSEYTPDNPVSYSRLSDSELGRLQRAFCRFEIYRHLFARCSPELGHDDQTCLDIPSLTPAEQARLFLESFPDFQVTEINCIRDYLYRRLRGTCSRLEDQAVDTLAPETFIYDAGIDVETAEWNSGVYLFTNNGKDYQNDHLEHLMSLGLAYVRRIFESTGEEKKNLFIRHSNSVIQHLEREFITRAIELLGRNPAGRDVPLLAETDPPFVYKINADVELDIPGAWQWAHPRAPPLELKDVCSKGLRDWGYVFWDLSRLRQSGILERSHDDVEWTEFNEFKAADGPSVQERLLGPPPIYHSEDDIEFSEDDDPLPDVSYSEDDGPPPNVAHSEDDALPASTSNPEDDGDDSEDDRAPPFVSESEDEVLLPSVSISEDHGDNSEDDNEQPEDGTEYSEDDGDYPEDDGDYPKSDSGCSENDSDSSRST